MESKTVLDSGLQAMDSGFQKLARFRNPQVRTCRIPDFLTWCVGETYLFINHFENKTIKEAAVTHPLTEFHLEFKTSCGVSIIEQLFHPLSIL